MDNKIFLLKLIVLSSWYYELQWGLYIESQKWDITSLMLLQVLRGSSLPKRIYLFNYPMHKLNLSNRKKGLYKLVYVPHMKKINIYRDVSPVYTKFAPILQDAPFSFCFPRISPSQNVFRFQNPKKWIKLSTKYDFKLYIENMLRKNRSAPKSFARRKATCHSHQPAHDTHNVEWNI